MTLEDLQLIDKNVGSFNFEEQKLLTNYLSIFMMHIVDETSIEKLTKVHNKRI
jgi:hypothetical protein